MQEPFEYVQNFTDKPIPEPYKFTPEEGRRLHNFQRRRHIEAFNDKSGMLPLTEEERADLERMELIIKHGTPIMYGGIELPFEPGQVYQVPLGYADHVIAKNPERLRRLTWSFLRSMGKKVTEVHFQTREEAISLMQQVGSDAGDIKNTEPIVAVEDGTVSIFGGRPQPMRG